MKTTLKPYIDQIWDKYTLCMLVSDQINESILYLNNEYSSICFVMYILTPSYPYVFMSYIFTLEN